MKGEIKPLQVGKISGRGTPSKEPKGPTELKQDSTIRRSPKAPAYYGKTVTSWSGKKWKPPRSPKPKAVPYGGRAQQLKAQGVGNAEIVRLAKTGAKRIVVPDKRG